jgi:dephospho-CoA kinase
VTLVIGITGPIGCGKSTVAGWLAEAGATIVDADLIARQVVEPGEPALAEVIAAFGSAIMRPDGTLDRAALGRIVFSDAGQLARLEAIVHPAVRPRILEALAEARRQGAPAAAVEAIKLVEGGLAEACDEVWLVVCSPEEQVDRFVARGSTREEAAVRIAAQAGLVPRVRPIAARVIDTSGSPEDARPRVLAAYRAALSTAEDRRGSGASSGS